MKIRVEGARENNLKDVTVEFNDGLTVVTGISGSGKTSLVFDTLYHEAERRLQEVPVSPRLTRDYHPLTWIACLGSDPQWL